MFGCTSALQLKRHCLWQKGQLEDTAVYFLKGKKLNNVDISGLRMVQTLGYCYKPEHPPHCELAPRIPVVVLLDTERYAREISCKPQS